MSTLPAQALPRWRRAVLKVGSNLLAADGGGLTTRYATALAGFIDASHAAGRQVVLVSSGAVAAGRALLREHAPASGDLAARFPVGLRCTRCSAHFLWLATALKLHAEPAADRLEALPPDWQPLKWNFIATIAEPAFCPACRFPDE